MLAKNVVGTDRLPIDEETCGRSFRRGLETSGDPRRASPFRRGLETRAELRVWKSAPNRSNDFSSSSFRRASSWGVGSELRCRR